MVDCPACAGPDNAECDTCYGESYVTQEVADLYTKNVSESKDLLISNLQIEIENLKIEIDRINSEKISNFNIN